MREPGQRGGDGRVVQAARRQPGAGQPDPGGAGPEPAGLRIPEPPPAGRGGAGTRNGAAEHDGQQVDLHGVHLGDEEHAVNVPVAEPARARARGTAGPLAHRHK